jgi:hypothetical protein
MKNSNDHTGNRSRDLPVCNAVLQLTAPPHTPDFVSVITSQAVHAKRRSEERLNNHCFHGKAVLHTFWVCVCNLSYSACQVRAPYCYLWRVRFYHIFPHYLITSTNFGKKDFKHKMYFDFLYNSYLKHFLSLEEFSEDIIKVHMSWCKVPVILSRF